MDRLAYLSDRCIKGLATEEELQELQQLMADPQYEEAARKLLRAGFESVPDLQDMDEHTAQEMMATIFQADNMLAPKRKTVSLFSKFRWIAAASVTALIALGILFTMDRSNKKNEDIGLAQTSAPTDVQPGKQGAILTLADGTQLVLDSMNNGFINAGHEAKPELNNGLLAYHAEQVPDNTALTYHTLTTPKGRQFALQLPDGTKVWLNAASSIRFPVSFSNKERKVEITGEAYFEVTPRPVVHNQPASQKIPFIVTTKRQQIEVLGTHFNVNAYDDEKEERTTLIEGKVRVHATAPGSSQPPGATIPGVVLAPGQQAVTDAHANLKTEKNVDVEKVMAWKNGYFNFADAKLEEAMRQLARWYNIEIVYEGAIPDIEFWGKMGRDLSLNDVLRFLNKSGVHFEIENGKKLIVKNQSQ